MFNENIIKMLNFFTKRNNANEVYKTEELVIGRLQYVSDEYTEAAPLHKKTNMYYIFKPIIVEGIVRYLDVLTGLIVDDMAKYFNTPYIADVDKLTDILPEYKETEISKLGLLLLIDEINTKKLTQTLNLTRKN